MCFKKHGLKAQQDKLLGCFFVHRFVQALYRRIRSTLSKRLVGDVDYSKYVDRDGLKYADLEQEVEVYPTIMRGATMYPIEGQSYRLSSHDAKSMINQLHQIGQLRLLTDTMQSLAERLDGTKLQTALPSLQAVNNCIAKGLVLPDLLLNKLKEWESLGASGINFDFVEQV